MLEQLGKDSDTIHLGLLNRVENSVKHVEKTEKDTQENLNRLESMVGGIEKRMREIKGGDGKDAEARCGESGED